MGDAVSWHELVRFPGENAALSTFLVFIIIVGYTLQHFAPYNV
jgi:hypothetical protein